jgi:hypothetical protein
MKTTLEIPDPLFRQLEAIGAARNLSLGEILLESLNKLATPDAADCFVGDEFGIPVLKPRPVPETTEFLNVVERIRDETA